MVYLLLFFSIIAEVIATSFLKLSKGFTQLGPTAISLSVYLVSFYLFSKSLEKIPLSIGYIMWAGLGSVLTVIVSVVIWKEKLSWINILGVAVVILGVVLINLKLKN